MLPGGMCMLPEGACSQGGVHASQGAMVVGVCVVAGGGVHGCRVSVHCCRGRTWDTTRYGQ